LWREFFGSPAILLSRECIERASSWVGGATVKKKDSKPIARATVFFDSWKYLKKLTVKEEN
jgi:hypothetical protein